MSDDNSANKFLKIMQKGFPGAAYRAVTIDGKAFKSKGYDHVKMEFESSKSKRLSGETKES
jgi:hypothetical protein